MTEAEWISCADPEVMLEFLQGKTSDRKLRLLACAFLRRAAHALPSQHLEESLSLAEQWADERDPAEVLATRAAGRWHGWFALGDDAWLVARDSAAIACAAVGETPNAEAYLAERRRQPTVIRELLGSPFRSITVDPRWLTSTVQALAQAVYEERVLLSGALDLARLTVLADALEEAGCTEPILLEHLRDPAAVHVRGCWALDHLLGDK